jgi:hypothetical protein
MEEKYDNKGEEARTFILASETVVKTETDNRQMVSEQGNNTPV